MNKTLLILCLFLVQGCSILRPAAPQPLPLPPVKIITESIQLEIYQPPLPPEIQLDDVQWFVLTEANLAEKITEVKRFTGSEFVIFGMTPQSYENMAYNFQEMRRYIRQQTEIIKYYREATKVKGSEGWLEENQQQQNIQLETESITNESSIISETVENRNFFSRLLPNIGN